MKKVKVGKSKIHGNGLFADEPIKRGDVIELVHTIRELEPGVTKTTPTLLGRNYNHSDDGNAINVVDGNNRYLVALKEIEAGGEITTNYRNNPDLEQPDSFSSNDNYVSFDYDDTLTTPEGFKLAQQMNKDGKNLYVITARDKITPQMIARAEAAGIPKENIIAAGSDEEKVKIVKENKISKHIDNKESVIKALGDTGELFAPDKYPDLKADFVEMDLSDDDLNKLKEGGFIVEEYQNGGESGDKFKKRLMKRYPGMQGVYGPEGENLNIVKDPNYDARSVGYGDIEFSFPGDPYLRYDNIIPKDDPNYIDVEEYIYSNIEPDKYNSVYNPRGANRRDVFLDMMHGMRDDPNFQPLLQNFEKAVKNTRGEDMDWQYEGEVQSGSTQSKERFDENYVDGQLRAELAPKTIGRFSKGRKDYRMERKYDSPEMKSAAKDIRNYLKGKYQDGGEPNKIRFVPGSYDPNEMAGYMLDEQEVVVPGKASNWGKAAIAYEKKNPEQKFIDEKKRQYLKRNKGLNKLYGLSMDNFPEDVEQNFRDEYDYKKNSAVVKQVGKKEGWNPNNRTDYVENLNDTQRNIVAESKYGSKLQPGTWNRALAGFQELGNTILPGQPFQYNIPGLTKKEQKEMRDSKLSALEVFAPMNTVGQNIANYTKNVGLSTGSDYKELPGFLSGEFMPNVDDSDAMGLDLVQLPLMLSGAAELPMLIGKGSKAVAKLMNTEDGLLSNAYKYNPWAFKADPEAYYHRSPNLENIINKETGMLQGFGESEAGKLYTAETLGNKTGFNLKKGANSKLYFSKGVPLDGGRYNSTRLGMSGQRYAGPHIAEVKGVPMGSSTKGRLPGLEPTKLESYAVSKRPISLDEVKFYKEHWLKGYKEVPKELPGSPNTSLELGKASRTVYPQPIANSMGLREYGSTIHAGPEWGPIAPKRMILYNNSTYADPSLLDESMQPFLLPREELMRRYPTDYMSKDELIGYRFKSGIKPLEYPTEIPAHFNTQEDIMARALGKPLPSRAKPKVYYDLEGNPISEEEAVRILNTREYAYGGFINRSKLNRFIS